MRIDHASMSALSLTKVRMSYNETHITSNTMDLCCSITRIYGMYRIRIYHTQNSLQKSTDARSRHEFEMNGQQQCTGQNNAMKSMGRAMHHGMVNVVIEQRLVSNHFPCSSDPMPQCTCALQRLPPCGYNWHDSHLHL